MQDNAKTRDGLWKKSDVCQRLNISLRTLNYRLVDGSVPFIKFGGAVRFVPDDIKNLEKSCRVGGVNKFTKGKAVT
jgi:hypothetical protein